jgi:hypothetical protein
LNRDQLLAFEIVLAFLFFAVVMLSGEIVVRYLFNWNSSLDTFDILRIFNLVVLGYYLVVVVVLGAFVDAAQKSHVRLLHDQHRRLMQQATTFHLPKGGNSLESPSRFTSPSKSVILQKPESPFSPIKTENEFQMNLLCRNLLMELTNDLEKSDRPVSIIGISLTYGLLWKLVTYLLLGVYSAVKNTATGLSRRTG